MIYLNKILPVFLLPTGMSIILLVIGLAWHKRVFCWAALMLLWIASTPSISLWTMRTVEGWQVRRPLDKMPEAQAIVVLSGVLVDPPGDTQAHEFNDGIDRFEGGVALIDAKKAPELVFTGGWVPWHPDARPEGEVLATLAEARGVPRGQIFVTEKVANTAAEAKAVAAHLLSHGSKEIPVIILVTSAFHMRRSVLLFEQAGLTVIPFPVDFRASEGQIFSILSLLPSAQSLAQTETALREFYGYLFYRLGN